MFIRGTAFVLMAGMLPAFAQDVPKDEATKSPTTPTTAQQPVAEQPAQPALTPAQQRMEIDKMAKAAHTELFAESPGAKQLYDRAFGCAVFDNVKLAFLLTGGGGKGVAIPKAQPEKRTYMQMGSAGVGVGLGAHKYQVVFIFETKEIFDTFVNEGWTADASANAVAGTSGANAEATFTNGVAIYQMTESGLMLQADISGTKYWKDDELNMKHEATD